MTELEYCVDFGTILDSLCGKEWAINNFVLYMELIVGTIENEKKKEKYIKLINAINKRNPKYLKNSDIAFVIGRDVCTVDRWIASEQKPAIDAMPILSKAFGISTDCLLGLKPFPEIDNEDYSTLSGLGFNILLFQNVYNIQCNEEQDFPYVLKALELLLKQKSSYSILSNIGKYLTSNSYNWGRYFSNINIASLKNYMNSLANNPPEDTIKSIDDFIEEKSDLKILDDLTIDNIIEELKKYRTELQAGSSKT